MTAHASHAYQRCGLTPGGPVSNRTGVIRLTRALLQSTDRYHLE